MQVLLAGSTGLVGSEVLRVLATDPRCERVIALTRRSPLPPKGKVLPRAFGFDAAAFAELAELKVDVVCCCLGTTIAQAGSEAAFRQVDYEYPLALARALPGAHYVLVSSVGASARSSLFYLRTNGELESALNGSGAPSVHVFRPSLLLGERTDVRSGERLAMSASRPLGGLFVGPLARYRPVEVPCLARAIARVSVAPSPGRHVYHFAEIAELAR
jgi:uncharacterized protein YbjT (DUF2867 family)